MAMEKTCTKCGASKPAGEFYKGKVRCKPCILADCSDYRQRNGERRREGARDYRRRNAGRVKARRRERYAEGGRERKREYRERNAERIREREREYRERNAERRQEYRRREWRERGEVLRERNREYKRSDPIANRAREHRRRVKVRENGGDFTSAEWGALCRHFGGVCLACGADEITIDHVLPVSKGGGNDISNLQPLCKSCNVRKGQNHVDYRDAGRLATFIREAA